MNSMQLFLRRPSGTLGVCLLVVMLSGIVYSQTPLHPLLWPISASATERDTLTSPFGVRQWPTEYDWHGGIDIRARADDSRYVHASDTGRVTHSGYDLWSGNVVDVAYFAAVYEGVQFRYAHLDSILVDTLYPWILGVYPGDTVGYAGTTPNVDVHLHLGYQLLWADPPGWGDSRVRRNPLELFPIPEIDDDAPTITNVNHVFESTCLDKLTFSVEVPADELDLEHLIIQFRNKSTGYINGIHYYLGTEKVVLFIRLNEIDRIPIDSIGRAELRADSIIGYFGDDPAVACSVALNANHFDCDTSTSFVLNVVIDFVNCYYTAADTGRITVEVQDFGGWDDKYFLFVGESPAVFVSRFEAQREGEHICLAYELSWMANATRLELRRSDAKGEAVTVRVVDLRGQVIGPGVTGSLICIDSTGDVYRDYIYRAILVGPDGQEQVAAVCKYTGLPKDFRLSQNYPNPFNSATVIDFVVAGPGSVETELVVYNVLGEKTATLHNGRLTPGRYLRRWDGRDDNGNSVASGVYFYWLRTGDNEEAKKMVLLK